MLASRLSPTSRSSKTMRSCSIVAISTFATASLSTRGKVFFDDAGNPVRIVEHVAGSDTFYNSVTNESVTGTINSGETVNLVDGTVTQNGSVGRITVPHMGVVFFDVGKYIIDFDEGLVFLAGSHHAFFEEDYAPLCALLA